MKQSKNILFISSADRSNLIAQWIEFVVLLVLFFLVLKKIILKPSSNYLLESICVLLLLIIFYFFFKKKNREPSFVLVSEDHLITRSFFYLNQQKIKIPEIIGFSTINRPYYVGRNGSSPRKYLYPSYLIYLKDGSKKLIISYNFSNFLEMKSRFKSSGIHFFGKDDSEWLGNRKKYKFDEK
jgi:hypothetical protein